MQNKKREALQNRLNEIGTIHNRAKAQTELIDTENKIVPFILVSDDNGGLRYDWWNDEIYEERLDVNGATFDNLNTFFKDHEMRVDNAIGKVINPRIEDNKIKADVRFGTDEDSEKIFNKYRDGILTDVSIGYSIQDFTTEERKNDHTLVTVTRFDIHELSAVWKGFDKNAKVGRNATNLEKEETPNEASLKLSEQQLRKLQVKELELKFK